MKKISLLLLLTFGVLHAQQDVQVEDQIKSIYSTALLNGQSYPWLEHLSNQIGGRLSCLNCLNIEENTKMCGVHLIEVDEKYTCNEFNGVE